MQPEREKFDFELYEKYKKSGDYLMLDNGNLIYDMTVFDFFPEKEDNVCLLVEIVHQYPYYKIFKLYYWNGIYGSDNYIKSYEKILPNDVRIDQSYHWDENGNLTIIDENKKFGKIRVDDIMKIVEKLGFINLKTGVGWFNLSRLEFNYELFFVDNKYGKYWIIVMLKGEKYDEKKHGRGDFPEYLSTYWFVDGETGELFTEEEWDARTKTKKSFWDRLFGK